MEGNGFRLFLGGREDAYDLKRLEDKQISYILNVAAGDVPTEDIYGDRYKCVRIHIEDDESFDISEHMGAAFRFIDEARLNGAGILVHCVAGVSRSPTVVIAYMMT